MSSPQSIRHVVAAEVRAEMGRQRKTGVELAAVLGISQQSASRRLRGETGLDLDEVAVVAEWLGVAPHDLLTAPSRISA